MIRVHGVTGSVEICDVLTSNRQFIHVKRKLGSSNLSHLFSQGFVSAELFLTDPIFRDAVRERISDAERARAEVESDRCFIGRFSGSLDFDTPEPRNIEVVYAVIAQWSNRTLAEALPFFSKVNLRRTMSELRRIGYRTSFCRIEVVEH